MLQAESAGPPAGTPSRLAGRGKTKPCGRALQKPRKLRRAEAEGFPRQAGSIEGSFRSTCAQKHRRRGRQLRPILARGFGCWLVQFPWILANPRHMARITCCLRYGCRRRILRQCRHGRRDGPHAASPGGGRVLGDGSLNSGAASAIGPCPASRSPWATTPISHTTAHGSDRPMPPIPGIDQVLRNRDFVGGSNTRSPRHRPIWDGPPGRWGRIAGRPCARSVPHRLRRGGPGSRPFGRPRSSGGHPSLRHLYKI